MPRRIVIVTPAKRGSTSGNRVTAERWAGLLRELGHRVRVSEQWGGESADVLIAIHAVKSASSIARFALAHPERPIVVAIAGTDVHRARRSLDFDRSLALATRVVVLQPLALKELSATTRRKTRVILQSASPPRTRGRRSTTTFEVALLAHLRPVKDPLRAARAARRLPASSRIVILHAGKALSPEAGRAARDEMRRNPCYRWLGELSRTRAGALLARCRVLVLTSRSEGGPSVLSEAAVAGIPILCTRIPGSVGLLGPRHPGYFPVGDTAALSKLLQRCESDAGFLERVGRSSLRLTDSLLPARERAAWKTLLEELP